VITSVVVNAQGAQRVYVNSPGVLQAVHVAEGQAVAAGAELAVLSNSEIAYDTLVAAGQQRRLEQHLKNLQLQRSEDDEAAEQIPHTREALESLEERLEELSRQQQRLTLVARTPGIVMPPAYVSAGVPPRGSLPTWSGTPFEPCNLNSWLPTGTLFCLVGDPSRMEAMLVIDQADIDFVREGQQVQIKLDEYPGDVWSGRIERIARIDLHVAPRELTQKAGGGLLGTETDQAGGERPASVSYQARVPLHNADGRLMPGFRGRAKIYAGSRTAAESLLRFLAQTIRFR
jgi:putative peptide zinc metalloprotease protein